MAAKGCLAAVAQGVLRPLALGRGRVRPLVFRLDRAVRCKQGENERIRMKRRKSEKNKVEKKGEQGHYRPFIPFYLLRGAIYQTFHQNSFVFTSEAAYAAKVNKMLHQ